MISRGQFLAATIAVLLLGISVGMFAGLFLWRFSMHEWRPRWEHHGPHGGPGGPGGPPPGVMRLERELDQSPAQRDSIQAIVERSHARFEAMRDSLRHEIEAQLTPKQRDEWQERERRREPWRGGPWPPPHGDERR